jgi:hypothetical protein
VNALARDIELLIRARHSLIALDTEEEERASDLLAAACQRPAGRRAARDAA